jgi:hypothetical protein
MTGRNIETVQDTKKMTTKKKWLIGIGIFISLNFIVDLFTVKPNGSSITSAQSLSKVEKPKVNDGMDTSISIENVDLKAKYHSIAFNTGLGVSMTLKNKNPYAVYDFKLNCIAYADSDKVVGELDKELNKKIEAGKTINVSDFNMGFVSDQATKFNCTIIGLHTDVRDKALGLK